jgi:hypothetical protein
MLKNKFWEHVPQVTNFIQGFCVGKKEVLDLGPGAFPFKAATQFCGWENRLNLPRFKVVDFSKNRLPYNDKEIDFCYCRHTLEDMYNPFLLVEEMSRISKSGYIEVPSPLSEMTKYIDAGSPEYKGYKHHRYLIWGSNGELKFLSKYPIVEHVHFDNENFSTFLEKPIYWNNYFLWENKIQFKYFEHEVDFHLGRPKEYINHILFSISEGINNSEQMAIKVKL